MIAHLDYVGYFQLGDGIMKFHSTVKLAIF